MTLGIQKVLGIMLWLLSSGAAVWYYWTEGSQLPRFNFFSGWVLLGLMIILTLYNGFKKLPFLPLGTSKAWLQVHIYIGLFTAVIFLIHLRGRFPTGPFEITLALFFTVVTLSGIFGLFLSRNLPKRLTTAGAEVPFDRIPLVRRELKEKARTLAFGTVAGAHSVIIPDFYVRRLEPFFSKTRNFWLHLAEIRRPINNLLKEVYDLNRYVGTEEKETIRKLAELVEQKNGLDYHYALQSMLKRWLFVHIPFTYGLLLLTVLHLVLVFAFSGGAQ